MFQLGCLDDAKRSCYAWPVENRNINVECLNRDQPRLFCDLFEYLKECKAVISLVCDKVKKKELTTTSQKAKLKKNHPICGRLYDGPKKLYSIYVELDLVPLCVLVRVFLW